MARSNIHILAISELKWTGMGEFNSDDFYIYYCGQEPIRRSGVALIVNKRVRKAVLVYNPKITCTVYLKRINKMNVALELCFPLQADLRQ